MLVNAANLDALRVGFSTAFQTGLSQAVSGYVLRQDAAGPWLEAVRAMLGQVIPGYQQEGKRLATLAVGCTGGKHRSTSMAEELARRLRTDGVEVHVVHRDLGLE